MRRLLVFVSLFALIATGASAMSFETPAGEINLYGSIRTYMFYNNITDSDSYRDIDTVKAGLQGNSRVGAIWKWENMSAHMEFGVGGAAHNTSGLRLFYADYKFNNDMGTFRAGQYATISSTAPAFSRKSDGDASLFGFGSVVENRRPGVMYAIKGFSVSLTTMAGNDENITTLYRNAGYSDVRFRELLPRIEMNYQLPAFVDGMGIRVFGSFAMINADGVETLPDGTTREKDFDATAFHVGAQVSPTFGDFYAQLVSFYSVNGGLYNMVFTGNGRGGTTAMMPRLKANGDVEGTDTTGVALALGYKVTPKVTVELAGGYQASNNKLYTKADCNMGGYINMSYKPNRWISIAPEVGYYDFMKDADGNNDAKVLQVGVQYRIDF